MPKDEVIDPITDQEMAFACQVLSGTMNDREAAHAVGLYPDSAAEIKSKPCVQAYMLGHRSALQQKHADHLVAQEMEGQRQQNLCRERVLARLWAIADVSPQVTRGSITSQVKALSMIVAMQGLMPDRCAGASTPSPQSTPGQTTRKSMPPPGFAEPAPAPNPEPTRDARPESAGSSSETTPSAPHANPIASVPDTRVPFSKRKKRRRR